VTTLQWAILAPAWLLMLMWLVVIIRGPRKVEQPNVLAVLRYGAALRTLAMILAILPPLIMTYIIADTKWHTDQRIMGLFGWRSDQALIVAGATFLPICLIAGLLLVEVVRGQVVLTEEAITRVSSWTGRAITLRWSDIERVRYSSVNSWFVLTGAKGTIRVSRYLLGIGAFGRLVKSKIAPERCVGAAKTLDGIAA
jgi:hypothetical protein